jgi:hypothetical protein
MPYYLTTLLFNHNDLVIGGKLRTFFDQTLINEEYSGIFSFFGAN